MPTFTGWVYTVFVLDVFSRRIVGWQVATSLYTELALDALDMGTWSRTNNGADLNRLVHHNDQLNPSNIGRFATRSASRPKTPSPLSDPRAMATTTMAEALNSLFKAELVHNKGPWRDINHLEVAVADWVDWYNHRRLHGELGHVPPVEHEHQHADQTAPRPTTISN